MWIVGIIAVVVALSIAIYNRLVGLRNRASAAWSDIDVQLKRRHNLVANLVETVKGYASHERETLEQIVQARSRAETARGGGNAAEVGTAESLLGGTLRQLFALAEAYPDLKANDQFLDLQRSLNNLEGEIQNARRYYNAVVRDLNTRIQSVPDVFVARLLSFKEREFFELQAPEERAVPRVDFGSKS